MNPHADHSTSLKDIIKSLVRNREIIGQMTKREVVGRYRGSIFGMAWSFMIPLLMLVVYTFVFSVVFRAKWNTGGTGSKTDFASILFVGIIVHSVFAECVNRAPSVILSNVNYVKKVVFPLECLVWVSMGTTLFNAILSLLVLLFVQIVVGNSITFTLIYLPFIFLPLVIWVLGISWFLASVGVYVRDIGQLTGVLTTIMLFLSPVFFSVDSLPEQYQMWILLNPLTFIIEQSRNVILWNQTPDWVGLLIYSFCSILVAWFGFWWFQRTRKGFADVI